LENNFVVQPNIMVEQGIPMEFPNEENVEEDMHNSDVNESEDEIAEDLSGTGPGTDYDSTLEKDIVDVSGPGSEDEVDFDEVSEKDLLEDLNNSEDDQSGIDDKSKTFDIISEQDLSGVDEKPLIPEQDEKDYSEKLLHHGSRSLLLKLFK
jgi:hypothetical protein